MRFKNSSTQNYIISLLKTSLLLFIAVLFFTISPDANANNLDRFRECTVTPDGPVPDPLDYNVTNGGEDFEYDFTNPYCSATVMFSYGAVKASIMFMNSASACATNTSRWGRPYPTPRHDAIDVARGLAKCTTQGNGMCCGAVTAAAASLSSFLVAMRIQYDFAKEAYHNTALCGSGFEDEWMKWNSNKKIRNIDGAGTKKYSVENTISGWIRNCNASPGHADCLKLRNGLRDEKVYREWFYGGVEREDTGANACPDVTRPVITGNNTVVYGGISRPIQRYYMRGTGAGNYACERFNYRKSISDPLISGSSSLSPERVKEYEYAYNCCMNRSRTSICVERRYCKTGLLIHSGTNVACPEASNIDTTHHQFCTVGSDCKLGNDVNYVLFESHYEDNERLICSNSKNLCPYNFNIGGGSSACKYYKDGKTSTDGIFTPISLEAIQAGDCAGKSDIRRDNCAFNNNAGRCENYCQYLNHCTVVGANQNKYESSITSPYFSKACIDFVGDSKNEYGFGAATTPGDISITGVQKHFTAPIAQCIRETLENIFYNRAGHSKCKIEGEYPNREGRCFSGEYIYQKDVGLDTQSFFSYLQENVTGAIKIVLTISIVIYGFKILVAAPESGLKTSELKMYVIKLALVLFFATGTAWQGFFFNGVYNASATFSTIVMNIKTSPVDSERDGCQFGKTSFSDGSNGSYSGEYPRGKEYLSIFDTFDCKIARYLGFGPSATVATIAMLIIPSLLSPALGAIGIYFAVFTMMFGICMLIAAVRSLHIFLTSAFAIILLIYVSPITITCVLFQKTKTIFDGWLNQLIGFSLQPILLFAYIGLFITIFETLVTGSATFSGQAPTKELVCNKICLKLDGTKEILPLSTTTQYNCDEDAGEKIVDPRSDSIACMLNVSNKSFDSLPILEPLGVAIPILGDLFNENGRTKILTMLKALIVIYILLGFIDDIPDLASNLMGGTTLPTYKMNAMSMAGKAFILVKAAQLRAAGGLKNLAQAGLKAGGMAARGGAKAASEAPGAIGNAARSVAAKMGGGKKDGGGKSEESGGSGESDTTNRDG